MDENKPNVTKIILNRDTLKWIIVGLTVLAAAILIFGAGMWVGGTKAHFSYRWAENYQNNFAGPRNGFLQGFPRIPSLPGDFMESRGTFGQIIQINANDLVVKGKDNAEKIILITDKTVIESGREKIKKDDLKVDDFIVVIGSPNDQGQIEAKLIRIFSGAEPSLQ